MRFYRASLWVSANLAALVILSQLSGRVGGSALAIGMLNVYMLGVLRASAGKSDPVEAELQHVLTAIVLALRRGRPLPAALDAGRQAAGPKLSGPLGELVQDLELGESFEAASSRLQRTGVDPGLSAALWSILFASEAGAPLPEMLERLCASAAHQLELKRQFQVLTLNGRLSAVVLSALPVGLLALLLPFRPELFRQLLSPSWELFVLGLLAVAWAIGLTLIARTSGAFVGRSHKWKESVDEEVPLLVDLVAEGLDLGMEPHRLLARLARSMPPNPLREQLEAVLAETGLGATLSEALERTAGSSRSPAFASFARALAGAGPGVGLGSLLRLHSKELRTGRYYELSLRVQRMPFQLMLVLVLLVFPLTLGLLILPIVASTAELLRHTGS